MINNVLEKPGTLSLDDMLFGRGGSKDTQHLKTDLTDWSFTKDHMSVFANSTGALGGPAAAARLPHVHFYFTRLDSFIRL